MNNLFSNIYKDKVVLVTGHTGFKGSWLVLWLHKMGAKVIGYSLDAPSSPNHFSLLSTDIISVVGDIRDQNHLNEIFKKYQPDIVFHLAAQALVRVSYTNPIETYETNVLGTLKVFEVSRKYDVKAIVNVTSDKVYENKEWVWGYKEEDILGGYDPYSSSKACSEILTQSYRNSYFNNDSYGKTHHTLMASCRAGNVIGGGDWAQDRLIPDIMIASSIDKEIIIRNPKATRPWQHVLEPLSGYLLIGQKLLEGKKDFASSWNFGPSDNQNLTVEELVKHANKYWSHIKYQIKINEQDYHEANLLKIDCSKAHTLLNWYGVWDVHKTFEKTVQWYKYYYEKKSVMTTYDLDEYILDAQKKNIVWTQ